MARGGGTFVVLGTTLVSVLAVAAAIGADAVAGTPDQTPAANLVMSDDFCTLMGELETYYAAKSAEAAFLNGSMDLTAVEDPAVLDAIHQQADPILEISTDVAAYLAHGAEVVPDATIAEALRTASAYTKSQGEEMAQLSRDVTSVELFIAALLADLDPGAREVADDASEASDTIADYVSIECAIDLSAVLGTGAPGDSSDGSTSTSLAAKADASTLGMQIATAFVDWKEGDPVPTVDLSDGMYGVTASSTSGGGTSVSTLYFTATSGEPAIVDQAIVGPTDWCVAVIDNAAVEPTVYRYSAAGGLEEGTCAALAVT